MTLYLVTANTNDDPWGIELTLFGVYTDKTRAKRRQASVRKNTETQS